MKHSRLESSVMICGGHKPRSLYKSTLYIFRKNTGHSRVEFSFVTFGNFLLWVNNAQACGAMESVILCTVMADCYYHIQSLVHFVFAITSFHTELGTNRVHVSLSKTKRYLIRILCNLDGSDIFAGPSAIA